MNNREYVVSVNLNNIQELSDQWKRLLRQTQRTATAFRSMYLLVPPVPMSTSWTSEQINDYLFGVRP